MLLDDLVFRLQHTKSDSWDGPDHFMFYKVEGMVKLYQRVFEAHPSLKPRNIFELGIFDGGSTAFWYEVFHPQKIVSIDIMNSGDSQYFKDYVKKRALADHILTCWRTDQSDKNLLQDIVAREFQGPLDLVIDDCSHQYLPTLASFEALFPLLAPGGLYIIEDWAWGHWKEYIRPGHDWENLEPPTTLVTQLIEVVGSTRDIIASLDVFSVFVVIERGDRNLDPSNFYLEDHIIRRADKAAQADRLFRHIGVKAANPLLEETDGSLYPPPVAPAFDETAYLQANPDVAQAVRDGHFPSGWIHYLRYGYREQRPGVFPPSSPL